MRFVVPWLNPCIQDWAIIAPFNNTDADLKIQSSTDSVDYSELNETVLGSSRKVGGAAEHLIDGNEKRICRLSLNFRVLVLLKGAVTYYSIFFDILTAFTGGQNFAANHVSILSSLTSPPPGLKTTHLLIGLAGMRTLKRKQSKCDIKHFNISCS